MATNKFRGKQVFKTVFDFDNSMQLKMEAAQEITMDKIINEILYPEFIQKRIYDIKIDSFYERTGVLSVMFQPTEVYHKGNSVYGGIETSSDTFMQYQNAELWQNQSKLKSEPPISATDFVNIINNGVEAEHSVFGERPKTKFWEDFIDYVYISGKYREIFFEVLSKLLNGEIKELSGNAITDRNNSGSVVLKTRRPRYFKDQESKNTSAGRQRRRSNASERKRVNKIKK